MGTTPFIDFQKILLSYSVEELMDMTGLQWKKDGKSYRCECPVHKGGKRSLVVTPDQPDEKGNPGVFYCFGEKTGGDRVGLLAHVRDSKPYAIFKELSEKRPSTTSALSSTRPSPVPEEKPDISRDNGSGEGRRGFYLPQFVSYDHEAVKEAMGISPELAESLGISYWKRGHHGKRVAFLLRHPDGRNAGCISLSVELVTELLLPPKWL